MYKKNKILIKTIILFQLSLIFNTYARDYSKDVYVYEKKGFYFSNEDENIKKYYFRENKAIKGIDVSKWQGNINWCEVKEAGIDFAMIRDGYGRKFPHQVDGYFHKNVKEAKNNGIKCGIYHYSYASNVEEAIAEAEFCIENIKNYKFEYPIAFDIEERRLRNLGCERLTEICDAFCNKMRQKGYYVTIYTYYYWVKNFLIADRLFGKYDLWLARYNWCPGYLCGIWQYTSGGEIHGIGGRVDCNISYFDYPQIIKELNLNGF